MTKQIYNFLYSILNSYPPLTFFMVGGVCYTLLYPTTNFILNKVSDKYKKCKKGEKYYILSNILKSSVLSVLSVYFSLSVFYGDFNLINPSEWGTNQRVLKNIVGLYAITDTVPLLINREKMKTSTIIHHICVFASYIYILSLSDFNQEGVFKSIIIYGGFSSLAYLVNFYLGSRFLTDNKTYIKYLKKAAGISYITSCGFNWTWQIYYMMLLLKYYYNNSMYLGYIKIGFLGTLIKYWIKDDLILIKHLLK